LPIVFTIDARSLRHRAFANAGVRAAVVR